MLRCRMTLRLSRKQTTPPVKPGFRMMPRVVRMGLPRKAPFHHAFSRGLIPQSTEAFLAAKHHENLENSR